MMPGVAMPPPGAHRAGPPTRQPQEEAISASSAWGVTGASRLRSRAGGGLGTPKLLIWFWANCLEDHDPHPD